MSDQLQQARELFVRYQGSNIQMHKEGVLKQYKQFEVPRETETGWFQELITGHTQKLSIRDWEAVSALEVLSRSYQDPQIVQNAVSFASRNIMSADSIVRLVYGEELVNIIRSNTKVLSREQLFSACRTAVQILEAVIAQPLVVDPGHELQQLNLKDKRGLNSRAQKSLAEVEGLLN
jgi:hypothetical protein